jgi:hypothetical protein
MKSRKLPKKHNDNFDAFEKPKKSGAIVKKEKRSQKMLSIYDELDEMDKFVLNENEYRRIDDIYNDDDENLY